MNDARPRLICVDDHEGVVGGMRITLRKRFDVIAVTDGAEALRRLRCDAPVAILITDMRMPGMDGVEVLRRARELSPATQRILLTGFADADAAISAVNDGAVFRYLTKPCSPPELRDVCSLALDRHEELVADEGARRRRLGEFVDFALDTMVLAGLGTAATAVRASRIVIELAAGHARTTREQLGLATKLLSLGRCAYPGAGDPREPGYRRSAWRSEAMSRAVARSRQLPGGEDYLPMLLAAVEGRHEDSDDPLAPTKIIDVATFVAELEQAGMSLTEACEHVARVVPDLAQTVGHIDLDRVIQCDEHRIHEFGLGELQSGMIAARDIVTTSGTTLVTAGTVICSRDRILEFSGGGLPELAAIELLRPGNATTVA